LISPCLKGEILTTLVIAVANSIEGDAVQQSAAPKKEYCSTADGDQLDTLGSAAGPWRNSWGGDYNQTLVLEARLANISV